MASEYQCMLTQFQVLSKSHRSGYVDLAVHQMVQCRGQGEISAIPTTCLVLCKERNKRSNMTPNVEKFLTYESITYLNAEPCPFFFFLNLTQYRTLLFGEWC